MPALPLTDATWMHGGLRGDLPVLVAVTATWCASNDATVRDIDRIADEVGERLAVLRLDFDANPLTVRRFAITSIPTILVLERGQVVRRLIGARSLARLREELAEYLDPGPGAPAGPGHRLPPPTVDTALRAPAPPATAPTPRPSADPEGTGNDVWEALQRTSADLTQHLSRSLVAAVGVTVSNLEVLRVLLERGGHVGPSELSEALGWESSRLSHQLTRLERRGLVHRRRSSENGRRIIVELSPHGERVARDGESVHAYVLRERIDRVLGPDQLPVLLELLQPLTTSAAPITGAASEGDESSVG